MLQGLSNVLAHIDWLALAMGVSLGVVTVLLIRARQAWANRQSFGYDVYTADTLRRSLTSWALRLLVIFVAAAGVYVWRSTQPSAPSSSESVSSSPTTDPLDGMRLVIPRLGISTKVIESRIIGESWDISQLTNEVAHLQGTVYPGQPGNAALAGHVTIPGAGWGPFRELDKLEVGDSIFIEAGVKTYNYRVADKSIVLPTDVEVAYPTGDTRLTLMTCAGWDDSTKKYAQRIVVVAKLAP